LSSCSHADPGIAHQIIAGLIEHVKPLDQAVT